MTDAKDTPGVEALRRMQTQPLRESVENYEQRVKRMPKGTNARAIVERLISAGRAELDRRAMEEAEGEGRR